MWTLDTRALNYILTHSVDYQKPDDIRRFLASLVGRGLLFTEGTGLLSGRKRNLTLNLQPVAEHHRHQRRVMVNKVLPSSCATVLIPFPRTPPLGRPRSASLPIFSTTSHSRCVLHFRSPSYADLFRTAPRCTGRRNSAEGGCRSSRRHQMAEYNNNGHHRSGRFQL